MKPQLSSEPQLQKKGQMAHNAFDKDMEAAIKEAEEETAALGMISASFDHREARNEAKAEAEDAAKEEARMEEARMEEAKKEAEIEREMPQRSQMSILS